MINFKLFMKMSDKVGCKWKSMNDNTCDDDVEGGAYANLNRQV